MRYDSIEFVEKNKKYDYFMSFYMKHPFFEKATIHVLHLNYKGI